jgi:hypothetical protein
MQIANQVQFQCCWFYLVWDGISSREFELGRIRSNLPDDMAPAATSERIGHSRPYSPECVEGVFSELRLEGVLRSSRTYAVRFSNKRFIRVMRRPLLSVMLVLADATGPKGSDDG